ncbi:MAG: benzoyl-CoA reductase subunit A [Planctomycetota bacterium]|nr:MAG: benzoyl-CoA reductase subunit A [Planctomycetota bacterium]
MKAFIGIDLGSTTTKAVILDEEGEVLGKGLTNSRSNYDVACAIAKGEALADARFTLCAKALRGLDLGTDQHGRLLAELERIFRLAQHREQLALLRKELAAEVPALERLFPGSALASPVEQILARMEELAPSLFESEEKRRSDFFRDNAASQFAAEAERIADPQRHPYEALLGAFDKAILKVENVVVELRVADVIESHAAELLEGLGENQRDAARKVLAEAASARFDVRNEVGTGYGRARLPFHKAQIRSEILCHGLGAHRMFPRTRTVLDIGGQDTKAIQVDAQGIVTSFQMNDRCAAGCGRYLGYIADEMNLGVHELGPLAQRSKRHVKINSTCTVFAGAELRERLTLGQKREDILAGLHRAIILRAMSLLARSGGVEEEFTFTGGVANNQAAVAALRKLVEENYGQRTINISPNSIYTGALGAALFARRDVLAGASA